MREIFGLIKSISKWTIDYPKRTLIAIMIIMCFVEGYVAFKTTVWGAEQSRLLENCENEKQIQFDQNIKRTRLLLYELFVIQDIVNRKQDSISTVTDSLLMDENRTIKKILTQ